jgi:hypothetical protein
MKHLVISIVFLLVTASSNLYGQILMNGDFELMSSCPNNLGQVYLCNNWEQVVMSSDYYNCGFTSSYFPTNSVAFSGTGYMGFASYGDPVGYAEAIGQILSVPLTINATYMIEFAAKKVTGGSYAQNCGGVAVYGINGYLPVDTSHIHISQLPNADLLALSPLVQDTNWVVYNLMITTIDTVSSIVLTVEQVPSCQQCIMIDNVSVTFISGIPDFSLSNLLNVFPNPSYGNVTVETTQGNLIKNLQVYNSLGMISNNVKVQDSGKSLLLTNMTDPLYYLFVEMDSGETVIKKIINLN